MAQGILPAWLKVFLCIASLQDNPTDGDHGHSQSSSGSHCGFAFSHTLQSRRMSVTIASASVISFFWGNCPRLAALSNCLRKSVNCFCHLRSLLRKNSFFNAAMGPQQLGNQGYICLGVPKSGPEILPRHKEIGPQGVEDNTRRKASHHRKNDPQTHILCTGARQTRPTQHKTKQPICCINYCMT